ncbi:hypothetical protein Acsp05_63270 [Actinokineospora sp. NBRC 105648]|nr:hypothetical protein Acsp05_63270 [Actinokineospora sp. NBRC 105648]
MGTHHKPPQATNSQPAHEAPDAIAEGVSEPPRDHAGSVTDRTVGVWGLGPQDKQRPIPR